jgi:hypothetical protein
MKRFTETTKWEDPWFRKLSPELKLLWQWLLDHCDNAGVIEPDLELASFQIGYSYPLDTLGQFGDRVVRVKGDKFFLPKFIAFQYVQLSEDCKPHKQVFQLLEKHGIKGYGKGIHTLQEQDKDKEKEKDRTRARNRRGTLEEVFALCSELGLTQSDAEYVFHKWQGNGWTNGNKPIRDWPATVRQWKAGRFFPSQKTADVATKPKPRVTL